MSSTESGQSVDGVIKVALEFIQSLSAHVTRCAGTIASVGESFDVRVGWKPKSAINLSCSGDTPLIEGAGAANDEAVVCLLYTSPSPRD